MHHIRTKTRQVFLNSSTECNIYFLDFDLSISSDNVKFLGNSHMTLKKANQFQLYWLSIFFSITAHIFTNIATNPLPMVWNESYIRYIRVGALMVWPAEKRSKTNPKTEHWNHYALKTNTVHIHHSPYTSHKCNILWKKLVFKGNQKRQSFLVLSSVR